MNFVADTDPYATQTFFLLQQETMLAEFCLTAGLTAIRNGNLLEKGKLLGGFYNLSIGCERLFKLVLVTDYLLKHNYSKPTNAWLKHEFRHDLVKLHSAITCLESAKGIALPLEDRENEILEFLARFAKGSRYYNLDALTSVADGYNPLSEWGQILSKAITEDLKPQQSYKLMQEAAFMNQMLSGRSLVVLHDLDDKLLDLEGAIIQPRLQQQAAKFVVLRVFNILRPARRILYNLGLQGYFTKTPTNTVRKMQIPDFSDMLIFLEADRQMILRKKRWP